MGFPWFPFHRNRRFLFLFIKATRFVGFVYLYICFVLGGEEHALLVNVRVNAMFV